MQKGTSSFAAIKAQWTQNATKFGSPLPQGKPATVTTTIGKPATSRPGVEGHHSYESPMRKPRRASLSSLPQTGSPPVAEALDSYSSPRKGLAAAQVRPVPQTPMVLSTEDDSKRSVNRMLSKSEHYTRSPFHQQASSDTTTEASSSPKPTTKLASKLARLPLDGSNSTHSRGRTQESPSLTDATDRTEEDLFVAEVGLIKKSSPRKTKKKKVRSKTPDPKKSRSSKNKTNSAPSTPNKKERVKVQLDGKALSKAIAKKAVVASFKPSVQRVASNGQRRGPRKRRTVIYKQAKATTSITYPVYPHTDAEEDAILQALYNNPNQLFTTLRVGQLSELVSAFEACDYAAGDVIVEQGETDCPYFYVIYSGVVEFTIEDGDDETHVGTAYQGGSFGELALLYSTPRAATALALENCRLYRVDATTFSFILSDETQRCFTKKCRLLQGIHFLDHLSANDVKTLSEVMTPRLYHKNETIVRRGDPGNVFYVLGEGQVQCRDIEAGNTSYQNVTLKVGDYFGERSLVTDEPCAATIKCLTDCMVFCVNRTTFSDVMSNISTLVLKDQDVRRLAGIPFIGNNVDKQQLAALATLLKDKRFKQGESILVEKDFSKAALYLVREGTVTVEQSNRKKTETIGAGGYFGEALMQRAVQKSKKSTKSPSTVTAKTSGVCGVLSLKDFWSVCDPERNIVKKDAAPSTASSALSSSSHTQRTSHGGDSSHSRSSTTSKVKASAPSPPLILPPVSAKLENLQKHSILGEGAFGQVWLVSDKKAKDSRAFALKIQSKSFLVRENQVEAIIQEKIMLDNMKHPFLINLCSTYQDEKYIYMLMDVVQGGELFSLMHENENSSFLPEHQAKFYALCVADVLAYLHRGKYVYRDLKPENVMIDSQGYVKLIDFGFCKYLLAEKTYTLCGTPGYLSPETVSAEGHNWSSDHWALGILIYEMLTGCSPFYYEGIDQTQLFQSIVHDSYEAPGNSSSEARNLISRLLDKDPTKRLGSKDERQIVEHPWFTELDLPAMRNRQVPPPWTPELEGPMDSSYFNDWSAEAEEPSDSQKCAALSERDAKLFDGVF